MAVQSIDPTQIMQDPQISMTDMAIAHFSKQLDKSEETSVRLFITRSGCSGYMYKVELVSEPFEGDLELSFGGFSLFVEGSSIAILRGTEIDFKKDGFNEIVTFNNPNVTGECGCGESFVVEQD